MNNNRLKEKRRKKRQEKAQARDGFVRPAKPKVPVRQPESQTTQINTDATKQSHPVEVPQLEKVGLGEDKSTGTAGNVRDEATGLMPRKLQRLRARAVNWQQENRFKLECSVEELKEVCDAQGATIYDELLLNTIEMMQSSDNRTKALGVRTGATLAKMVQADDHAKLRAEISPTVFNAKITVDQRQDARKVFIVLPANNRDAEFESAALLTNQPVPSE